MNEETNGTSRPEGMDRSGGGAWTPAISRLVIALTALFLVLLGIFFYAKNIRTIVPLGMPVTIVFGAGFYFVMKYLWEDAVVADRAKSTGTSVPGTGEERGG